MNSKSIFINIWLMPSNYFKNTFLYKFNFPQLDFKIAFFEKLSKILIK